MKIIEITAARKKNLGNYESADLSVSAQLSDADDVDVAADNLNFFLDFKLNQPERERKLVEIKAELESGVYPLTINNKALAGTPFPEEAIKQREEWIAKYEEATDKFIKLEFLR